MYAKNIILIAWLVSCVQAAAAKCYNIHGDPIVGLASAANRQVELDAFSPAPGSGAPVQLYSDGHVFNDKAWLSSSGITRQDVLSRVSDANQAVFLYWLGGLGSKGAVPNFWFNGSYTAKFKQRAKAVNAVDVKHISSMGKCSSLKYLVQFMNPNAFKDASSQCVTDIIDVFQEDPSPMYPKIKTMGPFAPVFAKVDSSVVVAHLSADAKRFKQLPEANFQKLVENKEFCKALTPEAFKIIVEESGKAKYLKADCAAELTSDVLTKNIGAKIADVDESFFAKINTQLDDTFTEHAKTGHIARFAEAVPQKDTPCQYFNPRSLTTKNIGGLKAPCFLRAVENVSEHLNLGELWKSVKIDLFNGVDPNNVVKYAETLKQDDWEHMKDVNKGVFFKKPEYCSFLPPDAVSKDISVSAECFGEMNTETQSVVISRGKPERSFLSKATASKASSWAVQVKDGPERNGILGLLGLKRFSDYGEYLKHLGETVEGDNPCTLVDSMETLKDLDSLYKFFPKTCISEMRFEIDETDLKTLDKSLYGVLDMDRLSTLVKDWSAVPVPLFTNIVQALTFCRTATAEIVNTINKNALHAIDAECAASFPEKEKLDAGVLRAFSDKAFRLMTNQHVETFDVTSLRAVQYGQLGDDVVDRSKAAPAAIKSLAGLSLEHPTKFTDKFMGALHGDAYKTISKSTINKIPADSMVNITMDQAKNLPTSSLEKMNPARIAKFGLNVDTSKSPLELFTKEIQDKMTLEQKKAIQARRDATASLAAPGSSIETSVASVIVALVLGYALVLL